MVIQLTLGVATVLAIKPWRLIMLKRQLHLSCLQLLHVQGKMARMAAFALHAALRLMYLWSLTMGRGGGSLLTPVSVPGYRNVP